ncbi:hypothetical protein Sfum_4028 [Syntrophobacter fumaroxidans MPOB]|uniref:Uncharacterized protein n=1 Tax=Syntrophobacter fumaroxidans (strain DSM 10017 / MPOB) TaxID=335543 RepID=A0LQJ2_SYNFM|nr:hypothetical protein Sfum_4028 [Syntrophobacter fumaroxidans MPOB]
MDSRSPFMQRIGSACIHSASSGYSIYYLSRRKDARRLCLIHFKYHEISCIYLFLAFFLEQFPNSAVMGGNLVESRSAIS